MYTRIDKTLKVDFDTGHGIPLEGILVELLWINTGSSDRSLLDVRPAMPLWPSLSKGVGHSVLQSKDMPTIHEHAIDYLKCSILLCLTRLINNIA